MTLVHYDFETGPQGAACNVANTGASVIALNGGTAIFDAAASITGNFGMKLTASADVNGITARYNASAINKQMVVTVGFMAPTTPTSDRNIFNINGNPDVAVVRVSINASNHIVVDSKSLTNFVDTNVVVVPGRMYRMAFILTVAATPTTTNGICKFNVFAGNNGVPLNATQFSSTTWDLGTAAIAGMDFNVPTSKTLSVDDVRFNDGSAVELGPAPDTSTPSTNARPTSVVSNPGAFVNVGSAIGLAEALADESDATYVSSPGAPSADAVTFALAPLTLGPVTVTARHRSSASTPAISRKYELMQGSTVIATRTVTLTTSWVDYTFVTTTGETAAINSPRNDLRLRVTDTSV